MNNQEQARSKLDSLCSKLKIKDVKFYLNEQAGLSFADTYKQATIWIQNSFDGKHKLSKFEKCDTLLANAKTKS